MDAPYATALAAALQAELDSGRTETYAAALGPFDASYAFDVDNVRAFVRFLSASGGFEIH